MKKLVIILFIFSLGGDIDARKMIIKMATLAPEGTEWYGLLAEMGQRWQEVTNGEIRLRIYPGGVVGDERDMIRKIRIGQIHGAAISAEGLTEVNPQYTFCFIPMFFQSYEDIDYVRDSLKKDLLSGAEKNGFKVLTMVDVGWVYWFTKEPIYIPNDLKKQKIFTWAGDYKTGKLWDQAGFNSIPLAVPDVHSGLQTGLINAMAFPPIFVLANQYFGITSHMLDMKWGILTAAIVIDQKIWNRIKSEYQDKMLKIADDIGREHQLNNREDADKAVDVMKEYGLQVNTPSIEQVKEWESIVESMYPLIRGNVVNAEVFDRVIKMNGQLPSRR